MDLDGGSTSGSAGGSRSVPIHSRRHKGSLSLSLPFYFSWTDFDPNSRSYSYICSSRDIGFVITCCRWVWMHSKLQWFWASWWDEDGWLSVLLCFWIEVGKLRLARCCWFSNFSAPKRKVKHSHSYLGFFGLRKPFRGIRNRLRHGVH